MNTIIVTEKDLNEKIIGYEESIHFDNFIFNDFRVILKRSDFKVVYKVHIENNINEVLYRMIKDGSYQECKFSFAENEEGWNLVETPNGDLIDTYIENMSKKNGKTSSTQSVVDFLSDLMRMEISFIVKLKQYIMNESYKRITIQKEGRKAVKSSDSQTERKSYTRKPVVQFLLGDIIEYVGCNKRSFKIACECWNVRGHFRHYKDGKVVWIAGYEKGKKRNTNSHVVEHVYNI